MYVVVVRSVVVVVELYVMTPPLIRVIMTEGRLVEPPHSLLPDHQNHNIS